MHQWGRQDWMDIVGTGSRIYLAGSDENRGRSGMGCMGNAGVSSRKPMNTKANIRNGPYKPNMCLTVTASLVKPFQLHSASRFYCFFFLIS
jgi:hypothetical protein